ncbi:MAG: AAA family ATPase [Spirochaetes bacterium]|nr:AAA family ATPase [Spirochaetota bacterium]
METTGRASGGHFVQAAEIIGRLRKAVGQSLVGKDELVNGLLSGLICDGHVLLEGVPGLAKTLAVRTLAAVSGLDFKRIQFTPDLLPGDITGTLFYDAKTASFVPRQGPVFCNVVLADEINRAPAKVQSALLEAMEERQVSMGDRSLRLPDPFFVLATQNPVEHEGTFRLPEAQLDRFMLKLLVDYPDEDEELAIVRRYGSPARYRPDTSSVGGQSSLSADHLPAAVLRPGELDLLKRSLYEIRFEPVAEEYLVRLVRSARPSRDAAAASQRSQALRELCRYIEFGPSPRASLYLYRAARAMALLQGRDTVLPDDIKQAAPAVLRHRLVPSYEAEADRVQPDALVKALLAAVPLT